ncbi:MAG: DNA recombination protein RmuC [Candidatus Magasanikbacteria bacterium]|nr:DNA recombination protein RmuC [Candidatus Magasanikbacteria bacterium]
MLLLTIAIFISAAASIYVIFLLKFKSNQDKNLTEIKQLFSDSEKFLIRFENLLKDELVRSRSESGLSSKTAREELSTSFSNFSASLSKQIVDIATLQKNQLDAFSAQINSSNKEGKEDLSKALKSFQDTFGASVKDLNDSQKLKLDDLLIKQGELIKAIENRLDIMREAMEGKLKLIQDDNSDKLEKMRATVDEKLHNTLENRLGQSFKMVTDKLDLVHKGLGEMQVLATGVGDLKKVLSNVKTKGVLGEYQLENLLEQLLTAEQYSKNVKTKEGSGAVVEFAIKLPGRDDKNKTVWLPIDSKFPTEDYELLLAAYEKSDPLLIETASKQLAAKIKSFAKDIRDKYVDPPNTTDFAIMFLPFEGLYAEVLRINGLFEMLQRECKVNITGPTTLGAFLNSLQMGFRTLAIEKRSSEVWEVLGAVKTEFSRFGDILDKTQKKLSEASSVIDQAGVRSRVIERKLRDVQELPKAEALQLLGNDPVEEVIEAIVEQEKKLVV